MLALYRAGRQVEALEHYRARRAALLDELGLEPSQLQARARRDPEPDPTLDLPAESETVAVERDVDEVDESSEYVLVAPRNLERLSDLIALAEPLAASFPARELIVAGVVSSDEPGALARTSERLLAERDALIARDVPARVAAFTSSRWATTSCGSRSSTPSTSS